MVTYFSEVNIAVCNITKSEIVCRTYFSEINIAVCYITEGEIICGNLLWLRSILLSAI